MEGVPSENASLKSDKRTILKNMAILILVELLHGMADNPSNRLQSSLNIKDGIGPISRGIGLLVSVPVLLFFSTVSRQTFGRGKILVTGYLCRALYVVANMYGSWYTLLPASILSQTIGAIGRQTNNSLLAILGRRYSVISGIPFDKVLGVVYALQRLFISFGSVIGDAFVYLVINKGMTLSTNLVSNETLISPKNCGVLFQDDDYVENSNFNQPPYASVLILFGCLGLVALLGSVSCLFLSEVENKEDEKEGKLSEKFGETLLETVLLIKNWKAVCLFVLSLYLGAMGEFFDTEMDKSFLACLYGLQYVGLFPILFDVVGLAFAMILSAAIRGLPRWPFFILGFGTGMSVLLLASIWRPGTVGSLLTVLLLVGGSSTSLTVVQILVNVLCGLVLPMKDAIFTIQFVANHVGRGFLAFSSSFLSLNIEIYTMSGIMVVMLGGFSALEHFLLGSKAKFNVDKPQLK